MNMTPTEARAAGSRAFTADKPATACPHSAPELRGAWLDGWKAERNWVLTFGLDR